MCASYKFCKKKPIELLLAQRGAWCRKKHDRKKMKGCKKKQPCRAFIGIERSLVSCFRESRAHKKKSHNNNKTRRGRRGRNVAKTTRQAFLSTKGRLMGFFSQIL
jgi:hypothetical protein